MDSTKSTLSSDEDIYRLWFDDPQGERRFVDLPRRYGIGRVSEGVWLNAEWQEAMLGKEVHWIPPSRIVLVTLVRSHE